MECRTTAGAPLALRLLGNLDITLLVCALPIFIGAGPAAARLGGRHRRLRRRSACSASCSNRSAAQADDLAGFLGVMVGGVIARGFFVAMAIFGVGMIDGDARRRGGHPVPRRVHDLLHNDPGAKP